ncbi:hypothetical protein APD23_19195, partial [Acinetobacter baumannii]
PIIHNFFSQRAYHWLSFVVIAVQILQFFIKITFLNQLYYFINETIDKHLFNFINFLFFLYLTDIFKIFPFIETQYKLRRLLQSFLTFKIDFSVRKP